MSLSMPHRLLAVALLICGCKDGGDVAEPSANVDVDGTPEPDREAAPEDAPTDVRCGLEDDSCAGTIDCCAGHRCREGRCLPARPDVAPEDVDEESEVTDLGQGTEPQPFDPREYVEGTEDCLDVPIGDPCETEEDCRGGVCLQMDVTPYEGGYCSLIFEETGCCPLGSRGIAGQCFKRCGSDTQCRLEEGYRCIHGVCSPSDIVGGRGDSQVGINPELTEPR